MCRTLNYTEGQREEELLSIHTRHLRGRRADEAKCHCRCCAALCFNFSVVQYIIHTSVSVDSVTASQE